MTHSFESEIKERLELAKKLTDISPQNRDILVQIIEMELRGTLKGSYSDIPNEVYHHNLCSGYSSTVIKRLYEESYNHWFEQKNDESDSLRFGSAFHAFCNEPFEFESNYIISHLDSRRGKEYQLLKAKASATGKTILMQDEFELIKLMSTKLFAHPDAAALVKNAKNELSFFSQDQETGLWKKCRVDGISGRSIYDLKTCLSAAASSFMSDAKKYLYRISASYYLEIISEVYNSIHRDFFLIACEKQKPNEIAVYKVHEHSLEKAQIEIRAVLNTILNIKINPNSWRGLPLGIKEIAI